MYQLVSILRNQWIVPQGWWATVYEMYCKLAESTEENEILMGLIYNMIWGLHSGKTDGVLEIQQCICHLAAGISFSADTFQFTFDFHYHYKTIYDFLLIIWPLVTFNTLYFVIVCDVNIPYIAFFCILVQTKTALLPSEKGSEFLKETLCPQLHPTLHRHHLLPLLI